MEGLCRVCRLIVKMKRELNYYYDDSDHYDYLQLPLSLLYSQGKNNGKGNEVGTININEHAVIYDACV